MDGTKVSKRAQLSNPKANKNKPLTFKVWFFGEEVKLNGEQHDEMSRLVDIVGYCPEEAIAEVLGLPLHLMFP